MDTLPGIPAPRNAPEPSKRRPGPKSALGENPRERLYECAMACFARNGIRGTSMDDIAAEAGVTRAAVYYYFPSKEHLMLLVVAREAEKLLTKIADEIEPLDGIDRVIEAVYLGIRLAREDPDAWLLVAPDIAALTAKTVESDEMMAVYRNFWHPVLQQAGPQIRSDRDLDDLMEWIVFIQFALTTHADAFGFDHDNVRDKITTYLKPALRPQP